MPRIEMYDMVRKAPRVRALTETQSQDRGLHYSSRTYSTLFRGLPNVYHYYLIRVLGESIAAIAALLALIPLWPMCLVRCRPRASTRVDRLRIAIARSRA